MNEKIIYTARAVGGAVVIRMPKHTLGQKYTETEGRDGVIYLRPVEQFKPRETQIQEAEKNRKGDFECVQDERITRMTEKQYEAMQ